MFNDLIWKRRSCRQFTDEPVAEELVDTLVDTALLAPTSRNLEPCRFVVITDKKIMAELAQAKPHGAAFLKGAPLGIAVCADPTVSDVWVEDASIASIYLHLAAMDLGLGSCWVQIRKRMYGDNVTAEERVSEILGLDPGLKVEAIIGIGHPAKERAPRTRDTLDVSKVSYKRGA